MSHIVTCKPSATILSCEGGSYSKRMRPGRRTIERALHDRAVGIGLHEARLQRADRVEVLLDLGHADLGVGGQRGGEQQGGGGEDGGEKDAHAPDMTTEWGGIKQTAPFPTR